MRNSRLPILIVFSLFANALMAQLVVTLNPSVTICEGTSIQLMPTVTGGDGDYSFVWGGAFLDDSFIQNPTASPVSLTTYSVNVTDGNGLTGFATVTITVATINITQESISPACFGQNNGSISLMTTPTSLNYEWNNGSLNSEITGLAPATYCVTITDFSNGCSVNKCYTVTESPEIGVNISVLDTDCNGESTGAIDLTVTGGAPGYTYTWSTGETTEDISSLIATSYTVDVTDTNNCTVSETIIINEPALLEIDFFATVIINVDCNGESTGSIDLTVTGGTSNYAYLWNTGETTEDINGLSAGNSYIVTVTDANGCASAESFTIIEPSNIEITSQTTMPTCGETDGAIDLSITGGVAPYLYIWSNGAVTEDIAELAAGTYFITVQDANNCTATSEIEVYNDIPAGIAGNLTICLGESTVLSASGGTTYSWNNGEATASITVFPLVTTSYRVMVTDSEGCTNIATVIVEVTPAPSIETNIINTSCNGLPNGEIWFINPLPEYQYIWSNGATTSMINNLAVGTYCVSVLDLSSGCQSAECFTVQEQAPTIVNITGLPEDECDDEFTIEAVVSGGTSPYLYLWLRPDGSPISTSSFLGNIGLVNGTYTLIVTDANDCMSSQIFLINQAVPFISFNDLYLDCNNAPISTLPANDNYPSPQYTVEWVGPDGFTYNEVALADYNTPGEYTLTITNTDFPECPFTTSTTVHAMVGGINVNLTDCNTYTLMAGLVLPPDFFGQITALWTMPDGATSNLLSINPTLTGTYTVMISLPAFDCELFYTQYIDLESESCSTLEGYVRYDESENCIAENTEVGIFDIIVTATNGNFIYNAITDESGYYRINVPSGIYTITHNLPSPSWIACEESYSVDLSASGTMEMLDIPMQGLGLCPELSVTLSAPSLRRCFFGTYNLTVCNEGTETAIMPEVVLLLDDFLGFNSASIIPDAVNGQQINWIFDEIGVGECKTIIVSVTVSCDAVLGQIHCTEAYATDYPFCGSADDWLGANLEIIPSCNGDEVIFNIKNNGLGDLTEVVRYVVIEDAIAMMPSAGTIDDLPVEGEATFSFPANGSTYTFILDQAPSHPYTLSVSSSIEGCGTNDSGTFSTGFVNQFNQQTSTPTGTIFCLENTGAFDPNDKSAIPVGYSDTHYIEPEDKINYRIRFQNTGTDTAFTVVVRDSLSELLDVSTLQRGNSSHSYRLDISGERMLIFTFNNILLPDSTTNLEGSNGFIDFSILPKSNAPLESIIENNAAIYFDFNEPVITNTVFHTLGRDFYMIVNWTSLSDLKISLNVYPNPASDKIQLGLENIQIDQQIIRILDMNGKQVYQSRFFGNELLVDIQQWPSNWYAIQILDKNGVLLGSGRLIKQ